MVAGLFIYLAMRVRLRGNSRHVRILFPAIKENHMARKYSKGASKKVESAMKKRNKGTLKSGRSGKKVTSRKQAIAIGLSEARAEGKRVPKKKTSKKSAKKSSKKSGKKSSKKSSATKSRTGRKSKKSKS